MSAVTVIIGLSLTAVFGGLFAACRFRSRSLKALTTDGQETDGTVTEAKLVQNQNGDSQRVTVQYSVNGTAHTHMFFSYPDKYHEGQHVTAVYLPQKPKLAYIKNEVFPRDDGLVLAAAVLVIYALAMLFLILSEFPSMKHLLNNIKEPLALLTLFFTWLHERSLLKKSKTCKGTVVYTGLYKRTFRVKAEYEVNGVTYVTRDYQFPQKHPKHLFTVGETVDVLYREKHPEEGILAEDTGREKRLRIGLLILTPLLLIIWGFVLYITSQLPA